MVGRRIRQGDSSCADGQASETFRHVSDLADRVEQLLGGQQPRCGVRGVNFVVGVEVVLLRAELVSPARHDRLDGPLPAEALFDKLLCQLVHQLGVGGWVGIAEVVDGIDNASPHQVTPDAVHAGSGEERIVRSGQPVGEDFSPILLYGHIDIALEQQMHFHRLAGARLYNITGTGHVDDFLVRGGTFLAADPSERGSDSVIVVLAPSLEWMVMALGTLNADAEEQLSGRLGGIVRVTAGSPVVGSRVLKDAATRCQQFGSKLVESLVIQDAVLNPPLEFVNAGRRDLLAV